MTAGEYMEFAAVTKAGNNVERIGEEITDTASRQARHIVEGGRGMTGFSTPTILDTTAGRLSGQTRKLGERAGGTGRGIVTSAKNLNQLDADGAGGFRTGHRDVDGELTW